MAERRGASSIALGGEVAADTLHHERSFYALGFQQVAGVDEAGRGPLAGPVTAACVILSRDCPHQAYLDSKKLPAARREVLFSQLHDHMAAIGVGVVAADEIDRLNILRAALEAMRRAVLDLTARNRAGAPDFLLVDGIFQVPIALQQRTLVKGETKSASIAAASIIAKVTRDRLMLEYDRHYPQYGFAQHKGYPTKKHRQAIACFGPCPIHRRSFSGVREFCSPSTLNQQASLWPDP